MASRFRRNANGSRFTRNGKAGNGGNGKGGNGNGNGNGKLTPKQAKFIDEYLIDLNATQAAIRAGYSKRTAQSIAAENLQKPVIQNAIQERRLELSLSTKMDQEWVLNGYRRLIDFSIDDFVHDDGSMKALKDIPKDKLYAIIGMETQTTTRDFGGDEDVRAFIETVIRKFKLPNKKDALDSVAKYLGMFEKDNRQKNPEVETQINVQVNIVDD